MLAASALTNGSAILMKDVIQKLQLPAGTDQGFSSSSPGNACTSTQTTAPPVTTVSSGTAAPQQSSTEAASTVVSRNGRDRDSSWLQLEACREHTRQACPRTAEECRYAHPDPRIYVKDGRVTCCYDYLKDRCYRERCRYFHPPDHIKDRLVNAGRQFGAMMSNLQMVPGGVANSPFYGPNPSPINNSFSHLNAAPLPLMGPVIYSPDGRVISAAPPGFIPSTLYGSENERINVCPYFAQGKCQSHVCPMLHPEPHVRLNLDSTVTVCRDFVRGGCSREKCRYFHPPDNTLSQLDNGAMPALLQQGIVVASPVVPVYPPIMYPGAVASLPPGVVTSLPSPVGSGVPLYPSVPTVPVPLVLTPPPPPVSMVQHFNSPPISEITSVVQGVPTIGVALDEGSALQSIIMAPPSQS